MKKTQRSGLLAFGSQKSGLLPVLAVTEKYIRKGEAFLSQRPGYSSNVSGDRAALLDLMMVALGVYELQVNRVKVNGGF